LSSFKPSGTVSFGSSYIGLSLVAVFFAITGWARFLIFFKRAVGVNFFGYGFSGSPLGVFYVNNFAWKFLK